MAIIAFQIAFIACTGCIANRFIVARYDSLEPGQLWEATVTASNRAERADRYAALNDIVISSWADRSLPSQPEGWKLKVRPPRVVLAKLAAGRDIEAANRFLMEMTPWNASGSEWDVRELWGWNWRYDDSLRLGHRGDYDFTQSVLITILYEFGDQPELLYPETVEHLVENLLVDRGGSYRPHAPRSLGLVPETENHLLMTESARYLTNQWLIGQGKSKARYDNQRNGLGERLAGLLENILEGGLYEFNSITYLGYALQPLTNLEAYANCPQIAGLSRRILDAELWRYAFSSLEFRRYVPFRRNVARAGEPDFTEDKMTQIAAIWMGKDFDNFEGLLKTRLQRSPFALDAAVAAYRPPENLMHFMHGAEYREYFVRMGRGRNSSPELYSAGPGYLISAGGVAPPRSRDIAVRPIVLILSDGVHNLEKCIRIPVAKTGRNANRTGVYHRLAVGDAPVQVPENFKLKASSDGWRIFRPLHNNGLQIGVFNGEDFGLFVVFPSNGRSSESLLEDIQSANANVDIRRSFVFPYSGNKLEYDADAPRRRWVMKSATGNKLHRDFTFWPRLSFPAQER